MKHGHGPHSYQVEHCFPSICPVMMKQALQNVRSPDSYLSFRLLIEASDDIDNSIGGERYLNDCILPIEDFVEFFIVVTSHADHNRARRGRFEITMAKFVLSAGFAGFVEFTGTNDEVPAPLGHVCKEGAMFVQIESLQGIDGIVNVEFFVFPCHFHQRLVYGRRSATDA